MTIQTSHYLASIDPSSNMLRAIFYLYFYTIIIFLIYNHKKIKL